MTRRRRPLRRLDHYREAVWNAPDLEALEKHLLHAMTRWMDVDTLGGCKPGWPKIIRRTSMSRATVGRKIDSVMGKGWLVCDFKGGLVVKGGKRVETASVYRGVIPDRSQRETGQNGDRSHSETRPVSERDSTLQGPAASGGQAADAAVPDAANDQSSAGEPATYPTPTDLVTLVFDMTTALDNADPTGTDDHEGQWSDSFENRQLERLGWWTPVGNPVETITADVEQAVRQLCAEAQAWLDDGVRPAWLRGPARHSNGAGR